MQDWLVEMFPRHVRNEESDIESEESLQDSGIVLLLVEDGLRCEENVPHGTHCEIFQISRGVMHVSSTLDHFCSKTCHL